MPLCNQAFCNCLEKSAIKNKTIIHSASTFNVNEQNVLKGNMYAASFYSRSVH